MKKLAAILWIASQTAFAGDVPTLNGASGVIVKTLGSYDTFNLDAGQAVNCEQEPYVDHCDIQGGAITISTEAGTEERIVIDRYTHSKSEIGATMFEDWTYHGTWIQRVAGIDFVERASLRILERSDAPGHYYGYFKIGDLAISHQLRAEVEK